MASITADGQLRGADGALYASPSAWSLHCKRELQPELKTDDGNRSIRYGSQAGPTLEALKQQLPVRALRFAALRCQDGAPSAVSGQMASIMRGVRGADAGLRAMLRRRPQAAR